MARYVVLSVDDNTQAQKLVEMIEKWKQLEIVTGFDPGSGDQAGNVIEGVDVFVRALYAKPTLFCESRASHGKYGFSRGKKFGWMVCAAPKCGKPTRAWAQGDGWFAGMGTNLLPKDETRPEYRGVGKRGHHWDGNDWVPDAEGEGAGA